MLKCKPTYGTCFKFKLFLSLVSKMRNDVFPNRSQTYMTFWLLVQMLWIGWFADLLVWIGWFAEMTCSLVT